MFTKIILVALGGACGSVARYLLSGAAQKLTATSFPLGTLVVNVLGCFLIGLLGAAFSGPILIREEYRTAVLVGVLGGLTTFSTYGWETTAMLQEGAFRRAGINVLVSNGVCLCAVWFGYRLARRVLGV